MSSRQAPTALPTFWLTQRLEEDRLRAIEDFREERMQEPLEKYLDHFDAYRDVFETLMELTIDLTMLNENAVEILSNEKLLEALRYLPGPPISLDDLKVVADVQSISGTAVKADGTIPERVISTIMMGIDRSRFPWMSLDRTDHEPTDVERQIAVAASAAMIACQRTATERRGESKNLQEAMVCEALIEHGFKQVVSRKIAALADAPAPGEFCPESLLGTRKADIVVRLWDHRVLPLECKVSNSYTNSIKRLNNDAAVKAVTWREEFGKTQVVPAAVLSGVYKLLNLEDAQNKGLVIYWAHSLDELTKWIDKTRP